jgi:aspartate beta-hydroxylase
MSNRSSSSSSSSLRVRPDFAKRRATRRLLWPDLLRFASQEKLKRIEGLLEIWCGEAEPDCLPGQKAIGLYMPQLPSSPWLDVKSFPFASQLERSWRSIKGELRESLRTRKGFVPYEPGRAPAWAKPWKKLVLCANNQKARRTTSFPVSMKILDEVRNEFRWVAQWSFLLLGPGGELPPHRDRFNYLVSVHLGIDVPEHVGLRVGSEARTLGEGKCVAFDNSFLHTAWNRSDRDRIVLAAHLFHPHLTAVEREALRVLHPLIGLDSQSVSG